MNNKDIGLFNYVYSSMYETEKDDDVKWQEFEKICKEKMNYLPYDFIIKNKYFVTMNEKNMCHDILGNKTADGEFVILNYEGTKEFVKYKINEIRTLIKNFGIKAFEKVDNIFENMCNEAVREILIECQNQDLIDFEDYVFIFTDNGLMHIRYDEIKVIINEPKNEFSGNTIFNNGQIINQLGNNNSASISNMNDKQLFDLLSKKIEAIKNEMKDENCKDKLEELEIAMTRKDKVSALEILSHLSSIGSFICAGISMLVK